MPIEFRCPFCDTPYRLKDELAGKTARCRNTDCRKVMAIPQPKPAIAGRADGHGMPNPPVSAIPSGTDAEAIAQSALADEPPPVEKAAASGTATIAMTCEVCEHHWTEPRSKAGKNTICPECQRRQRVPEPKPDATDDWRQQRAKLPSLAKRDEDVLEGVQATTQAQVVSGSTLAEAGAIEEEYDALPASYRAVLYGVPLVLLLAAGVFVWSWWSGRGVAAQGDLMSEALASFKQLPPDEKPPTALRPLYAATLELAAGEQAARQPQTPDTLAAAQAHFASALAELRNLGPKERKRLEGNALLAELALAVLALGGTDEQVATQTRYRWLPDTTPSRMIRVNDRTHTVFEELRRVLQELGPDADFELRVALARKLTRELIPRGQAELVRTLPVQLFGPEEQMEAKALLALEIRRLDPASPLPAELAENLKEDYRKYQDAIAKKTTPAPRLEPYPASAAALWKVLNTQNAAFTMNAPSTGKIQEPYLRSTLSHMLLQNRTDVTEAIDLTKRSDRPETQLRGLALIAEWAATPGPTLEAAQGVLEGMSKVRNSRPPQGVVYRLSQLAAQAGNADLGKKFAERLPDGGPREWATAEVLRWRLAMNPAEPADVGLVQLPADVKDFRPGHAWGCLQVGRQNGRQGNDGKAIDNWSQPLMRPFGKAGLALGLQDRSTSP